MLMSLEVIGKAYGGDGKRLTNYQVLMSDYYTYWYRWRDYWQEWEDL